MDSARLCLERPCKSYQNIHFFVGLQKEFALWCLLNRAGGKLPAAIFLICHIFPPDICNFLETINQWATDLRFEFSTSEKEEWTPMPRRHTCAWLSVSTKCFTPEKSLKEMNILLQRALRKSALDTILSYYLPKECFNSFKKITPCSHSGKQYRASSKS